MNVNFKKIYVTISKRFDEEINRKVETWCLIDPDLTDKLYFLSKRAVFLHLTQNYRLINVSVQDELGRFVYTVFLNDDSNVNLRTVSYASQVNPSNIKLLEQEIKRFFITYDLPGEHILVPEGLQDDPKLELEDVELVDKDNSQENNDSSVTTSSYASIDEVTFENPLLEDEKESFLEVDFSAEELLLSDQEIEELGGGQELEEIESLDLDDLNQLGKESIILDFLEFHDNESKSEIESLTKLGLEGENKLDEEPFNTLTSDEIENQNLGGDFNFVSNENEYEKAGISFVSPTNINHSSINSKIDHAQSSQPSIENPREQELSGSLKDIPSGINQSIEESQEVEQETTQEIVHKKTSLVINETESHDINHNVEFSNVSNNKSVQTIIQDANGNHLDDVRPIFDDAEPIVDDAELNLKFNQIYKEIDDIFVRMHDINEATQEIDLTDSKENVSHLENLDHIPDLQPSSNLPFRNDEIERINEEITVEFDFLKEKSTEFNSELAEEAIEIESADKLLDDMEMNDGSYSKASEEVTIEISTPFNSIDKVEEFDFEIEREVDQSGEPSHKNLNSGEVNSVEQPILKQNPIKITRVVKRLDNFEEFESIDDVQRKFDDVFADRIQLARKEMRDSRTEAIKVYQKNKIKDVFDETTPTTWRVKNLLGFSRIGYDVYDREWLKANSVDMKRLGLEDIPSDTYTLQLNALKTNISDVKTEKRDYQTQTLYPSKK